MFIDPNTEPTKFPPEVIERLGCYVYIGRD